MMKEEDNSPKEEQHPSSGVEVPAGSPTDDQKEPQKKDEHPQQASSKRGILLGVGGLLLVIAIVLAITLPLTLNDSSDDSGDDAGTSSNALDELDSSNESNGRNTSEYGYNFTTTNTTFDDGLALFGRDITRGYKAASEVESDLTMALTRNALGFIEQQISWNQNNNNYEEDGGGEEGERETDTEGMPPPEMAAADSSLTAGDESASEGVTDYATNNQEENVDEADIIKADANFVYAAYGDYILVWDTDGNQVGQAKMPQIEMPDCWNETHGAQGCYPSKPGIVEYLPENVPQVESEIAEESPPVAAKSMIYEPWYGGRPKPSIDKLLLTDNHLVAFVTGYNQRYYHWGGFGIPEMNGETDEMPILNGYRESQIRLYRKSESGALTFVGSQEVNGYLVDARSMGDNVHLATTTSLDVHNHLESPLYRDYFAKNLTLEQYRQEATQLAEEKLIPEMTRKLTQELGLQEGDLPRMLRINKWMTTTPQTADTDAQEHMIIDPNSYDVVRHVATVTSFNVNDDLLDATTQQLDTSTSMYLAPDPFNTLYGTQDKLVLATQGWDWSLARSTNEQTTYLVALDVNGASTSFISVGTVRGHLLNQYALDIVGNELRAATTVDHQQWWWGGPMPFVDDMVVDVAMAEPMSRQADPCPAVDEPCMTEENREACRALVDDGCASILTMESCPLQFGCEVENSDNGDEPTLDDSDTSEQTDILPRPPPQEPEEGQDRTDNYMSVLLLVGDTEGQMGFKGSVEIGEPNERIMSVRFFDDVAYAVTFEQTDPFYVLDMSVPKVLGELKLPGFSSYLHSMNADNTMLVAVGQNATSDGRTTGVMVTVFDATDPSNPIDVVSHVFETGGTGYSSSDIQWDYKAFRLVGDKLIMPMSIYYYEQWNPMTGQVIPVPQGAENFEGFVVLEVTETSITEEYRISHSQGQGYCRYCNGGYLPTRSFVYSGDLMTVRQNRVVSTDLDTGDTVWTLDLQVEGEPSECCW